MQLKAVTGAFFFEFSKFETQFVGMALRSLSKDPVFVEQAEKLLNLEARLKLLERMAFAVGVSPVVMKELGIQLSRARILHEKRDEVARSLAVIDEGGAKPHLGGALSTAAPARRRGIDYERLSERRRLPTPDVGQIQGYTNDAIGLQEALSAITANFDLHMVEAGAANQPGASQ